MSDINADAIAVKQQVRSTYDSISSDFDRTRRKPWPFVAKFMTHLPEGILVLDIGCGNGKDALAVLEHGCPCVCIDISNEQCRIARGKLEKHAMAASSVCPPFEVLQADCESLPFKDAAFDAVLFIATLHHVPSGAGRLKALAEMKRIMRPNAKGLISVWDFDQERFKEERNRQGQGGRPEPPGIEFGDVMVPWKTHRCTYKRYYHLFLLEEFEALIRNAGFSKTTIMTATGNHYAEVVR
jgi:tRNA (uracil-5-)-methyltransferase TRM9